MTTKIKDPVSEAERLALRARIETLTTALEAAHAQRRELVRAQAAAGMTRRAIAALWGVSNPMITRLINGPRYANPTVDG